jgi:hypothetical protein
MRGRLTRHTWREFRSKRVFTHLLCDVLLSVFDYFLSEKARNEPSLMSHRRLIMADRAYVGAKEDEPVRLRISPSILAGASRPMH